MREFFLDISEYEGEVSEDDAGKLLGKILKHFGWVVSREPVIEVGNYRINLSNVAYDRQWFEKRGEEFHVKVTFVSGDGIKFTDAKARAYLDATMIPEGDEL